VTAAEGDLIDLGLGQPDLDLLPLELLEEATRVRFSEADKRFLEYGPTGGTESFRERLAGFLRDHARTEVGPEGLFVSAGASHGLDLVLGRFTRPGDTILVEEPTYFYALGIMRARHLSVVSVSVDGDGMNPAALEEALERHRPVLIYTIPTHHNPTSQTMPEPRRAQVVALAKRYHALVVADEVYQMLCYDLEQPRPMCSFDDEDVLSLGSFSKILAPGLRLGWVEGPPTRMETLAQCGVLRGGGGVSPFTVAMIERAIDRGLQADYLAEVRDIYRDRARGFGAALRRWLPAEARFEDPRGGFFVWLELPEGLDSSRLLEEGRGLGVGFRAGPIFSSRGKLQRYLRMSFTYYPQERLELGAKRLGELLDRALAR
jgi:DNA-binding transcriptional MocR family regulator